ncbi:MAG: peroxiredoxin family protein [Halodesulfurarchaeum sp.]
MTDHDEEARDEEHEASTTDEEARDEEQPPSTTDEAPSEPEPAGPSQPDDGGLSSRQKLIAGFWAIAVVAIMVVTVTTLGGAGSMGGEPAPTTTTQAEAGDAPSGPAMGATAPPATFTLSNGTERDLSRYLGDRILLWFPAATCETCQIQAARMARNASRLRNLTVIALTPRSMAGAGAPTGRAFAEAYAPATLNESNWVWGVPSRSMVRTYNPEGSHGLGYLINESGHVVARGSRPANSLDVIAQFANGSV